MWWTSLTVLAALWLSISTTSGQVLPTVTGLPGLKQAPPAAGGSVPLLAPTVQPAAPVMLKPMPRLFQILRGRTNAPLPVLKPGIYETAPYTSIVIVPGPHADDVSVIGGKGTGTGPSMPTIKPDLQFIPRATMNEPAHGPKPQP